MGAFGVGQPGKAGAVKFDAILLSRDVAVFRAIEINEPGSFIYTVNRACFPLAVSYLVQQFAVLSVVVDVLPTVARARPEKRAVFEPGWIVYNFNPGFGRFAKECC